VSGTGQEKEEGADPSSAHGWDRKKHCPFRGVWWTEQKQAGVVPMQVPRGMNDTLVGTGPEKDKMVPSLFRDRTEPDASHSPRRTTGRRQGVREMVETDTQYGRLAEREIILVFTDFSLACHLNGFQGTEVRKSVEKYR
jgi:hypothetical protein